MGARLLGKMARGLARDQSRDKALKKKVAPKGAKDDLTPAQRVERDKKALEEKKAAKEALKKEKLEVDVHGNFQAQLDKEEARKLKQRAEKKERAKQAGQCAKQNRKMLAQ